LSDVKHEDEALKSMREREMAAAMNDAVMAVRRGMERMGIP
jgi:hypothetical protein